LKIGTKLTIYLSFIIIVVISGYGYLDILSRRDILTRKMKAEARSTGRTLKLSLERIFQPDEMGYIQGLIDAVSQYERTFGVIVYFQRGKTLFHTPSLGGDLEPFLDLIRTSIREKRSLEKFHRYKKTPLFSYAFPLKNVNGEDVGGVSVLQRTSFMEEELRQAKWNIFFIIFLLIGGTVTLVLIGTKRWVTLPISKLIDGVKSLARGNLDQRITLDQGNELAELARAFNRMAVDLKNARNRIIREGEEKLELERRFRQTEKLAIIGQLASGLAHEIGTPLNIILGRAELIKRKLGDQTEMRHSLDTILSQTRRITQIIQQLLGFVRKKKPELKTISISGLMETTLDLLDQQIQKQGIRTSKIFEDPLPLSKGDPDQLQQVFLNIVLNAIQSMPEGGGLHLSVSSKMVSREGLVEFDQRPYLEIAVADTGKGMEKEVIRNIFTPFYTTKKTGTGLGLMVTQGILQDHEGWIDVESRVGEGSVFRVFLPAWPEENKG
jgi:signal transduction histidine kinase